MARVTFVEMLLSQCHFIDLVGYFLSFLCMNIVERRHELKLLCCTMSANWCWCFILNGNFMCKIINVVEIFLSLLVFLKGIDIHLSSI